MVIWILMFSLFVIGGAILLHGPWFKITAIEKDEIRKNGLLHYTTSANSKLIINNKFLNGKISDMGGIEKVLGKLVWTYKYEHKNDIEKYHKILISKKRAIGNKEMYNVCIKLTGFNETDLNKFYKRIGFNGDKAIVYRGEKLKPYNIEIIKKW